VLGLCGVALVLGTLSGANRPARADEGDAGAATDAETLAPPEPLDGPVFTVTRFDLDYREPHPDLPPIESLLPLTVRLRRTTGGWAAPLAGRPTTEVRIDERERTDTRFHASALGTISRAILARLHDADLLGVYVRPSAEDIDITTERDLRAPGDTELLIGIWVGRIDAVRTVAIGDRIDDDWTIDNPVHRKIRSYSPLHPAAAGIEDTTDLLDRRELEDYVHRLNRHPGRHVEASLAASDDRDGITLDYRVYESRPWNVYAQVSNTGSERTSRWQTRAGYVNRQVTNRDDILSIEYLNAGLDRVHGIQAGYEAPWFAPRRPGWMKSSGREPGWLAWADRSEIPWWGLGRLRWRVNGGWTGITTDFEGYLGGGFDAVDTVESSDWNVGGRFIYNAWQYRNLFLDVFADGRFRGVTLQNDVTGNEGDVTLLLLELGTRAERTNAYSNFFAQVGAQHARPLGSSDDYQNAFAADLGRSATDPRWWTINFDLGISYYLEPLLFPSSFRDPTTAWTSTLSHELSLGIRGQYAFDYRLIPQSSQVIGGLYTVRGFPQGIAVGDSVYLGTFEYRFHLPRSLPVRRRPVDLPWVGDFRIAPQQVYGRPDWDLVFRAFVDAGKSIRNDRALATGTEIDQTLVGAGVGVELVFRNNLRVRVDWAHGIYQSVGCDALTPGGQPDPTCLVARQGDIAPDGELYFLFGVVF
jgi:hypothetical protein